MTLPDALFLATGTGLLVAAFLPRALANRPVSVPLVFLAAGIVLGFLPIAALSDVAPDPEAHRLVIEHASEVVVIVALMGAGLAINRPFGLRAWSSTWRLLGITMPLTILLIGGAAMLGLGWPLAAALLLGAVLAPTDPVLAADVHVAEPIDEDEAPADDGDGSEIDEVDDEVRFALTSEAGLNDGLAFPFVYAAIAAAAAAAAGTDSSWLASWAIEDMVLRVLVGVLAGLLVGLALGRTFFRSPVSSLRLAEHSDGFVALGATALAYAAAEIVHGYGFVAVFVAACAIRAAERSHGYHRILHGFVEQVERLLVAGLLLVLGYAIANGALDSLTWGGAALVLAVIFVLRPLAGWVAMLGSRAGRYERIAIAFFGIRGIGSFYYLAFATGAASFGVLTNELWSLVAFAVLASVVIHGITAGPVMNRLDALRHRAADKVTEGAPSDREQAAQHP